ncbi:MAG: SDR family oxidoreductase [Promethearchaeota archaeon]
MDLRLNGKNILVTGGSKGIGFACAKILALEGARVLIVSRSLQNLEKARKKIRDAGCIEPDLFVADLSKQEDITRLGNHIESRGIFLDGIILNCGGPPTGNALSTTEQDWRESFNKTLMSVIRTCKTFVPRMQERKTGKIVAIASISAKQPIPNLVLSNTLRLGVIGYLKTLSNEVARDNVLINVVLPGFTRTERLQDVLEKRARNLGKSIEDVINDQVQEIPLGRLIEPEELANMVVFLLSGKNSCITGQTIAVDGGFIKFPV